MGIRLSLSIDVSSIRQAHFDVRSFRQARVITMIFSEEFDDGNNNVYRLACAGSAKL
jgi:hypothetical protein